MGHPSGYKSETHKWAWERGRMAGELNSQRKPPYERHLMQNPMQVGLYKAWIAGFDGKDRHGKRVE